MESIAAGRLKMCLSVAGPARLPRLREDLRGATRNGCGTWLPNGGVSHSGSSAAASVCAWPLRRRQCSSAQFRRSALFPSLETFTAAAAVHSQSSFAVEGAGSLWRRRSDKIWLINSSNVDPTPENLEEKISSANSSPDKSGPPVLTIAAGLLVVGAVFWALSSFLFWAIGNLYVWAVGVLLS